MYHNLSGESWHKRRRRKLVRILSKSGTECAIATTLQSALFAAGVYCNTLSIIESSTYLVPRDTLRSKNRDRSESALDPARIGYFLLPLGSSFRHRLHAFLAGYYLHSARRCIEQSICPFRPTFSLACVGCHRRSCRSLDPLILNVKSCVLCLSGGPPASQRRKAHEYTCILLPRCSSLCSRQQASWGHVMTVASRLCLRAGPHTSTVEVCAYTHR